MVPTTDVVIVVATDHDHAGRSHAPPPLEDLAEDLRADRPFRAYRAGSGEERTIDEYADIIDMLSELRLRLGCGGGRLVGTMWPSNWTT
ncbi:hypothetical protein ACTMTF_32270 [Nonomuraea sp. ZG12]|uniref:hypothetical protein n=1 Tax=Nonomuraea sp. ZG12 TaxID=3452207 RepID=UPI003F88D6EF